jgi:alkaline phosphatase
MEKWRRIKFLSALLLLTVILTEARAQPHRYTVANTHSHNDYEQRTPYWMAWQAGFGSIEADIWLVDGRLLIGHDTVEIKSRRTLEEYYLKPLDSCIGMNKGYPYADTTRRLQMLIDVKTDSVATLAALVSLLNRYPALERTPSVRWVISGRRPLASRYTSYPGFIAFDGILHDHYSQAALSRIVLMSDDLKYYTKWNGHEALPAADREVLEGSIAIAHKLHLPVRFWDAPDFPAAWQQLEDLRVDYLNTDHIRELATWLGR